MAEEAEGERGTADSGTGGDEVGGYGIGSVKVVAEDMGVDGGEVGAAGAVVEEAENSPLRCAVAWAAGAHP